MFCMLPGDSALIMIFLRYSVTLAAFDGRSRQAYLEELGGSYVRERGDRYWGNIKISPRKCNFMVYNVDFEIRNILLDSIGHFYHSKVIHFRPKIYLLFLLMAIPK